MTQSETTPLRHFWSLEGITQVRRLVIGNVLGNY